MKPIQIALLAFVVLTTVLPTPTEAFTSPRVKLCEKNFIGYEYNPKVEKLCRPLWITWTKQIINHK